jgi:hypothetical protein
MHGTWDLAAPLFAGFVIIRIKKPFPGEDGYRISALKPEGENR